jgi:hypothetical protein
MVGGPGSIPVGGNIFVLTLRALYQRLERLVKFLVNVSDFWKVENITGFKSRHNKRCPESPVQIISSFLDFGM